MQDKVQTQLLNILFVWAKLNPKYAYRQGMNELLAPLLLVCTKEATDRNKLRQSRGDVLYQLLDPDYIEHDSYALFCSVMTVMAKYFATAEKKKPEEKKAVEAGMFEQAEVLPIVSKCNHVHHTLLAAADPALYAHMERCEIPPQVYLLRWYRLLFAQNYHIEDILSIWDATFASARYPLARHGFVLADYLCVSMVLYVRGQLLEGDNSECLQRLMKYPPVENIYVLLHKALLLMDPSIPRPALAGQEDFLGNNSGATGTSPPRTPTGIKQVKQLVGGMAKLANPLSYLPSLSSSSSSTAAAASSAAANGSAAELAELKTVMEQMGSILDKVVNTMTGEYSDSNQQGRTYNTDIVLQGIAQIKHVKDVMLGRLSIDEILSHIAHAHGTSLLDLDAQDSGSGDGSAHGASNNGTGSSSSDANKATSPSHGSRGSSSSSSSSADSSSRSAPEGRASLALPVSGMHAHTSKQEASDLRAELLAHSPQISPFLLPSSDAMFEKLSLDPVKSTAARQKKGAQDNLASEFLMDVYDDDNALGLNDSNTTLKGLTEDSDSRPSTDLFGNPKQEGKPGSKRAVGNPLFAADHDPFAD